MIVALLPYVLFSLGSISALIPVLLIVLLIAAAAGLNRGFSLFNIFGIATLAGINPGGKSSIAGKTAFGVPMAFHAPRLDKAKLHGPTSKLVKFAAKKATAPIKRRLAARTLAKQAMGAAGVRRGRMATAMMNAGRAVKSTTAKIPGVKATARGAAAVGKGAAVVARLPGRGARIVANTKPVKAVTTAAKAEKVRIGVPGKGISVPVGTARRQLASALKKATGKSLQDAVRMGAFVASPGTYMAYRAYKGVRKVQESRSELRTGAKYAAARERASDLAGAYLSAHAPPRTARERRAMRAHISQGLRTESESEPVRAARVRTKYIAEERRIRGDATWVPKPKSAEENILKKKIKEERGKEFSRAYSPPSAAEPKRTMLGATIRTIVPGVKAAKSAYEDARKIKSKGVAASVGAAAMERLRSGAKNIGAGEKSPESLQVFRKGFEIPVAGIAQAKRRFFGPVTTDVEKSKVKLDTAKNKRKTAEADERTRREELGRARADEANATKERARALNEFNAAQKALTEASAREAKASAAAKVTPTPEALGELGAAAAARKAAQDKRDDTKKKYDLSDTKYTSAVAAHATADTAHNTARTATRNAITDENNARKDYRDARTDARLHEPFKSETIEAAVLKQKIRHAGATKNPEFLEAQLDETEKILSDRVKEMSTVMREKYLDLAATIASNRSLPANVRKDILTTPYPTSSEVEKDVLIAERAALAGSLGAPHFLHETLGTMRSTTSDLKRLLGDSEDKVVEAALSNRRLWVDRSVAKDNLDKLADLAANRAGNVKVMATNILRRHINKGTFSEKDVEDELSKTSTAGNIIDDLKRRLREKPPKGARKPPK